MIDLQGGAYRGDQNYTILVRKKGRYYLAIWREGEKVIETEISREELERLYEQAGKMIELLNRG